MSFGSRGGYGAGGRGFNDSEASGGYGNENFGGGISRGRGGTNFGRYAVCNGNDGRGGSFSGGGGFGGRTGDFDINNGGDSGGYRGEGFGGRSGSNLGSSGRGGFGCRTDDFNNNRGSSDAASDRGNFGSGGGRGGGFGGRGRGFGGDFGSRGGFGGDRGSTSNETGHGGRGHLVGSNSCQFANQGDSFRPPSQGFNRGNDFSDGRAVSNPYASDKAENFDDRAPCPPTNNFIPEVRSVDELYKEDGENAENYRQVAEDDDEIHVSGPNIDHYAVLDSWIDARFSEVLLRNIVQRSKYVRPRKIQAHVIPVVMDGRDVKGHAETGSGKTAAFMLPIIHKLMNMPYKESKPLGRPSPYAIIIEPTRELCCQVHEQGRKLAYETDVSVAKMYGQYKMSANLNELNMGCDILCATPGRLKHFITANLISVENVIFFVLDEADTLLESNFLDDIREIVNMGNFPDKESRQTMLFSATFPEMVQKLSTDVLKNNCVFVSNQKMVAANSRVIQCFESVACHDKKQKLFDMLMAEIETRKIAQPGGPELCRTLVFVRTKRDADLMSLFLTEKGIKATTINGDRMQSQREQALRDFRSNFVNVLVSTDVCARGIDIKDLDHVINMDLPNDAVTYVHRIGRTGRLKPGRATSFFDESSSNDLNIAKKLVEFVQGVGQEVPEFLQRAADGRGSGDYSSMVMQQASSGW